MKKILILLFIIPLTAQSINDSDEAIEEQRQEIKEQEQIRLEKKWKQREINRRKTREIKVGNISVGGGSPISVQSMTNTITSDVKSTVKQILSLYLN